MVRVLLVFLFLILLLPSVQAQAQTAYSGRQDADQYLSKLLTHSHNSGIDRLKPSERADWFAHFFVSGSLPFGYLADPLGEGQTGEFDKDPLFRFDGFDCTTFVETILALSFSKTESEFRSIINRVRYLDGRVSYENRNHFVSLEWIPRNSAEHFVKDITAKIAGPKLRTVRTSIEKDEWYRFKGLAYARLASAETKYMSQISYVSKQDLLNDKILLSKIPSGSIFSVVRTGWNLKPVIGTELDVSHQGMLVREGDEVYMIHASNGSRDGMTKMLTVKRDRLADYVKSVMMKSATTAGMNILILSEGN